MKRRLFLTTIGAISTSIGTVSLARAAQGCIPTGPGIQACDVGLDHAIAVRQVASEWCWAACMEGVFSYYGHRVTQIRIVKETWGQVVNMPGQPQQIFRDLNRSWIDDDGDSFDVSGDVYSANPKTAAEDLANDMPLIIGSNGHAMVLTAMRFAQDIYGRGGVTAATVRDPWPGQDKRILSAQEWYGISFMARIRVS